MLLVSLSVPSFVAAEQKKQKVSEVQGGLEDAESLVFHVKHI